jgi:hypothetical protein
MAEPSSLNPEEEQAVVVYLEQLARVMRGESHACLVCQAPVEVYREVRPCVYAEPCGHRQWQGRKPREAR